MNILLESSLKSIAVLGAAWVIVLCLRAKSAALRHLIWCTAFAGLLILPLLSAGLPVLRVPAIQPFTGSELLLKTEVIGPAQLAASQGGHHPLIPIEATSRAADMRMLLTLLWAGGAIVGLAQMLLGWTRMRQLRMRSVAIADPELEGLRRMLGIGVQVQLLETTRGSMPMLYGVCRPVVFIPSDAQGWSWRRRRMVLLHELAHVRRRDALTHLLARTALALYWWNPMAWFAWREFLKERERATDDLVLNAGECRSEYARHLLDIARSMQPPALAGPVLAIASGSQLEGRLAAILDSRRNRKPLRTTWAIIVLIGAMCTLAPVAAMQVTPEQTARSGKMSVRTNDSSENSRQIALGDEARDKAKYDEAAALYRKALKAAASNSEGATASMRLGTVEFASQNFDAAISSFKGAEAADSNRSAEAKLWTAMAQVQQGDMAAASLTYQDCINAADPHSTVAIAAENLYSQLLEKQGKHNEAIATKGKSNTTLSLPPASPATQHPDAKVYRTGGDVTAPKLITKREPDYTADARIAHYSGEVLVSAIIGEDGVPYDVRIVRGLGFGLDEKAIEAISEWRFTPGLKQNTPVAVQAQIEVSFRLL